MSGRSRLSAEQLDQVAEWREAGVTIGMIQRRLARAGTVISTGALSWQCLRMGVDKPGLPARAARTHKPVAVRGNHLVRRFTDEEDRQLLALSADGLVRSEIARRIGRRHNSVIGRLLTLARHEARAEAEAQS